jgi:serine/threonine protein kinase/Tol biopolymer transport system component
MTPDRLHRAFELFDAATILPEGERELFLARECGADAELCDDVRSLLSAHREAEGFLSSRRGRTGSWNVVDNAPELPVLASGTRLGSFAIESFVGAGGMGEVYKARDTRLDRPVAIKVLRSDTAADPRSRARFSFEARAIARLSHPRICAIHDIAHDDGVDFLVMEFLEGETLADRLRRKGMSLADALRTALEIAEALSAAHARGIVHRDLKPGNVMLTPNGARLLDFGLARLKAGALQAGESGTAIVPDAAHSGATLIVGTPHYMAPEQLEGKEVDVRADIFAFGIVVYEMVTGRKPFDDTTATGLITAILSSDPPPIPTLKPLAPVGLERLIRTCLVKNPDHRWANIHDVLVQLEWIARETTESASTAAKPGANPSSSRAAWIGVAAGLLAVGLSAGVIWWNLRRPPAEARMLVLSVSPPQGVVLAAESPPAISADGRRLAFIATDPSGRQLLYHQTLDSHDDARPIANTDGALFPFWSPNGSRIGFFADGQLKIVHVTSGRIQSLAPAAQPRGGTWNGYDAIVFVPRPLDGFYRIAADGGEPKQLKLKVPQGAPGWYPSFLPDGRHLLVYVPSPQDPDKARVAVISLDEGTRTDLISGTRSNAVFAAPGHLLFWRDGTLMAQPFDAETLQVHGNPLALPGSAGLNRLTNQALFSVSSSGTLVLLGGAVGETQLEWVDRFGTRVGTAGPTGLFNSVSLAPDDTKVVYDASEVRTGSVDLHRFDFATGQTTRLTFNAAHDMFPFWSRDGRRIFFNSLRSIPPELFEIDANSTGNERLVLKKPFPTIPIDDSSDGRLLIYQGIRPATNGDVFAAALDGSQQDAPVLETRANEGHAMLSPDGRLLAYISNESRRYDVFVRQFPWADGGRQWQVSVEGGFEPYWRRDGRELFFLAPNRTLMSVEVTGTGSTFDHGSPRALFPTQVTWLENQAMGRHYAPSRDGKRFLIANATDRARSMPITVVLNWAAGLADDRVR